MRLPEGEEAQVRTKRGGTRCPSGDVVTADRWCWAASVDTKERTRRGAVATPGTPMR
jgi:hypothetical protein